MFMFLPSPKGYGARRDLRRYNKDYQKYRMPSILGKIKSYSAWEKDDRAVRGL